MAQKKEARMLAIFDDDTQKTPKASIAAMARIEKEIGEIPDGLAKEDGGLDYELIAKIFWCIGQDENEKLTLDEVEKKLNLGNLHKALKAIRGALLLELPEELVAQIEAAQAEAEEEEPPADEEKGPDAKN